MRGKAKVVIATMVFGTLMLLGPDAHKSFAGDCYASDAMYGEGPAVNCQKSPGKVKLSRDVSSIYEEGLSNPGQDTEVKNSYRLIAKNSRFTDGDMFSEGMSNNSFRKMDMVALRTQALKAKPAAGH